jgi:hypothetical protein
MTTIASIIGGVLLVCFVWFVYWIISSAVESGVSNALEAQMTALGNIERVLEERLENIEQYLSSIDTNTQ